MVKHKNGIAPVRRPQRKYLFGLLALLVVGVVVAQGVVSRVHHMTNLRHWTDAQAMASVNLVRPSLGKLDQSLALPGRLEAFTDAPIFSRVSGYLKTWNVDIGARVKKGQVLAEIETPDLNAQLTQAQANLADAVAAAQLAKSTAKRWQEMMVSDSVSQQAVDEKTGDWQVKQADAAAAQANLQRLQALESYKLIVAPFDGIVTNRQTDIGQLITAGSDRGSALFRVADEKQLRVYVDVPQNYAAAIGAQMQATLTVPELPSRTFTAKYLNTASAINTASGAVTIELLVDNADGQLIPGAYTQVHLNLGAGTDGAMQALRLPATALILGDLGEEVATVSQGGYVVMKPVTIAHDLGDFVEIGTGITAADRVVNNPPDSIANGDRVRVASDPVDASAAAPAGHLAAGSTSGAAHA